MTINGPKIIFFGKRKQGKEFEDNTTAYRYIIAGIKKSPAQNRAQLK
ncbi:MAG: hypothetical protein IKC17_06300 [Bacteroidales bacterium]|nr:hypothetical protein [Bacteroidales bacterium]